MTRPPRFTGGRRPREVSAGSPWFVAATGRLRAPWRLSVFLLAFAVAWVMANALLYPVLSLAMSALEAPLAVYGWLMLLATLVAHVIALRQVDEEEWETVAFGRDAWSRRRLGVGLGVGAAAIAATLALLLVSGGLRAEWLDDGTGPGAWLVASLRVLWVLAPAALWEELMFRGYLWRVAEESAGARVALLATSVGFAAVHLLNPGANARTLGAVLLAGVCLGLVRQVTASVPAVWLAHLVWNWGMAAVAHVPVSGLPFEAPGWRLVPTEPAWWSGGSWGPEGGMAAFLVFTVALFMGGRWGAGVRAPTVTVTDGTSSASNTGARPAAVAPSGTTGS